MVPRKWGERDRQTLPLHPHSAEPAAGGFSREALHASVEQDPLPASQSPCLGTPLRGDSVDVTSALGRLSHFTLNGKCSSLSFPFLIMHYFKLD